MWSAPACHLAFVFRPNLRLPTEVEALSLERYYHCVVVLCERVVFWQ